MAVVAISNPYVLGTGVCGDLSEGAAREWLVPDGAGGYAMGTASGLRTRRYHALLVAAEQLGQAQNSGQAQNAGSARRVGLASLDPVLVLPSGAEVRLAVHEWASGAVSPDGHTLLESFTLEHGLPRRRWRVGDIVLEAELAAVHGRPAYGYVYRLLAGGPVRLRVEALCTWRDQHGERFASGGDPRLRPTADGVVVEEAYRIAGPGWTAGGQWYRDVHLREEAARGLGAREDLWFAGSFSAPLAGAGQAMELTAWAGDLDAVPPPAARIVAAARDRAAAIQARGSDPVAAQLLLAADAFVIDRTAADGDADGTAAPDVIAGYPWFGTWSRDTMISYEGLFLSAQRADEGARLLRAHGAALSEGMLANTADTGSVEYNTADATLWFVHAIGRHVAATGDADLAADLAPALDVLLRAHLDGTRYGIRVDPADSLLTQGADGYALTWMDARVDGRPITRRGGKAVEINALWINALGTVADLWKAVGRDATAVLRRREAAATSFRRRFPNPECGLCDVVDGPAGDDASLRPNQLLAYSLPHGPLRGHAPAPVVGEKLMTPLGPRTLAPDDPAYRPHHRGTPEQRDAAYHQGTAWPWLLGPYRDALAAAGSADAAAAVFGGLPGHLAEAGLGSVSETADGAAPHRTTGCPFQAWSVAEALRGWTAESSDRR